MTCLNPDDHGCDIKDHLLHYFGCIEIKDREKFFNDNHYIWQKEFEHQRDHLQCPNPKEVTDRKREAWKEDCFKEIKRIRFLRRTLENDENDKHLVEEVKNSRARWQELRKKRGKTVLEPTNDETEEVAAYEPELDISAPIIQFRNGQGVDVPNNSNVWNRFPNQKTALSDLLQHEDNLLNNQRLSSDRLGYFHIPSNNMVWAEDAISRYFGEERPDHHAMQRELNRHKKTRAYMVLRDQYWRSQLHGGDKHNPPHARHLRPFCETVSSDPDNTDHFPRNMVLFMPYLHWDISRRSEQFAMEVVDIVGNNKESREEGEDQNKQPSAPPKELPPSRKRPRINLGTFKQKLGLGTKKPTDANSLCPSLKLGSYRRTKGGLLTLSSIIKWTKLNQNQPPVDDNGRVTVTNVLAQYLIDAARLYEGMSNYRDKKLLRKYLCEDPPLHPRRTLDQAYHWTLSSTWYRDRDQVVYRHTTTKPESFHRYDHEAREWTDHKDFDIKGKCTDCNMDIKKLSRVVMVDQLWMWILDGKTIITCFPKRYGANKHDTSAIHKSIRVHLQESSGDQIRTIYDLALVILDECSNTFFDRTKTGDRQPLVLDAFSKAIGNIMQKQTAAFERLWRWTDDASRVYRSKTNGDTSGLHVPLLDINPEGQLEREIKDILEELDIMIHITKTHKKTLTAFIANAENMLDPFGYFGNNQKRKMISRYLWDKSENKPEDLADIWEAIKHKDPKSTKHGDCSGQKPEETEKKLKGMEKLKEMEDNYNWFKLNAEERLKSVQERIDELYDLRRSAENTADNVKDLLELKQQQASVVQAWQAVKQSEETIKQGRSIMMFTLVTIIFLPLSFMSSIFGMNNSTITEETSIQLEFVYMFSISAGVIFISLFLAFGSWFRAGAFYLFKSFMTAFLVKTGIYSIWLDINWPSKRLHNEAIDYSERLKKKAKIENLEHRRRRRERKEERARRNDGNGNMGTASRSLDERDPPSPENGHLNGNSTSVKNGYNSGLHAMFRRLRHSAHDENGDVEAGGQ